MFDWNDEELASIIWGVGENDEHIVPYPDGSEEKPPGLCRYHIGNGLAQEASRFKPSEQNKPVAATDYYGGKVGRKTKFETNEGPPATGDGMVSWPELSLSTAAKAELGFTGAEPSNSLTETSKCDSSREETAGPDFCSAEESDFVDYGWANIGSFDDLDFSNVDQMFTQIDSAHELWPSSKDATSSPGKSIPLAIYSPGSGLGSSRRTSELLESKAQCQDQIWTPGDEKMSNFSSLAPKNVQPSKKHMEKAGGKVKLLAQDKRTLEMVGKTLECNAHLDAGIVTIRNEFTDKMNRQRKLLKSRTKSEAKSEARQLRNLCTTCSPSMNQTQQFEGQNMPLFDQCSLSPLFMQQRQLQVHQSLQHKHFCNQLWASRHGNMGTPYTAIPELPQLHPGEGHHQEVPSVYEVCPCNSITLNKLSGASENPQSMTPQEKIEKLKRRQQRQAMLAIQNQQQQFAPQLSCAEISGSPKFLNEDKMQLDIGTTEDDENMCCLPFLDPNLVVDHDDPNLVSKTINNSSVADTTLFRLQDTIEKLGIHIRLCIRDSLSRLAKRHYSTDSSRDRSTNPTSRDDLYSNNRTLRLPDVETATNPIDRSVAHLLFHRPADLLEKLSKTPESPLSTKLAFLPERSSDKQTAPQQESKFHCMLSQGDQNRAKNSPCIDTSENASNSEAVDGDLWRVEVPQ